MTKTSASGSAGEVVSPRGTTYLAYLVPKLHLGTQVCPKFNFAGRGRYQVQLGNETNEDNGERRVPLNGGTTSVSSQVLGRDGARPSISDGYFGDDCIAATNSGCL
jgi:hypothetical protein